VFLFFQQNVSMNNKQQRCIKAESTEEGKVLTLFEASLKIKGVLLLNFWYWGLNWLDADLLGGYWRSLVVCSSTTPAQPPHSTTWSGSLYCTDRDYVIDKTTSFLASSSMISYVTRSFSMIILGAFADTYGRYISRLCFDVSLNLTAKHCLKFGRKKAIMISWMGWASFGGFMWYTSVNPDTTAQYTVTLSNQWGLILLGVWVSSTFNCFQPVASSIAADSCESSMESRGQVMAALRVSQNLGTLIGFSVGFWVLLQDLTDYSTIWMIFTLICTSMFILTMAVLDESLVPLPNGEKRQSMCANFTGGLRLISNDRFIMCFMFVNLLIYVAITGSIQIMGGFLLADLKLNQAVASLAGIVQQVPILLGVFLTTKCMRSVGAFRTQYFGMILCLVGHAIMGIAPFFGLLPRSIVWWFGFCVVGISLGLITTTSPTIISVRVNDHDQAKLQAVLVVCNNIGTAVGAGIWANYFFKAGVEGLSGGLPFLASAGVLLLALALYMFALRHFDEDQGGGSEGTTEEGAEGGEGGGEEGGEGSGDGGGPNAPLLNSATRR
jgi:MFS family permease